MCVCSTECAILKFIQSIAFFQKKIKKLNSFNLPMCYTHKKVTIFNIITIFKYLYYALI